MHPAQIDGENRVYEQPRVVGGVLDLKVLRLFFVVLEVGAGLGGEEVVVRSPRVCREELAPVGTRVVLVRVCLAVRGGRQSKRVPRHGVVAVRVHVLEPLSKALFAADAPAPGRVGNHTGVAHGPGALEHGHARARHIVVHVHLDEARFGQRELGRAFGGVEVEVREGALVVIGARLEAVRGGRPRAGGKVPDRPLERQLVVPVVRLATFAGEARRAGALEVVDVVDAVRATGAVLARVGAAPVVGVLAVGAVKIWFALTRRRDRAGIARGIRRVLTHTLDWIATAALAFVENAHSGLCGARDIVLGGVAPTAAGAGVALNTRAFTGPGCPVAAGAVFGTLESICGSTRRDARAAVLAVRSKMARLACIARARSSACSCGDPKPLRCAVVAGARSCSGEPLVACGMRSVGALLARRPVVTGRADAARADRVLGPPGAANAGDLATPRIPARVFARAALAAVVGRARAVASPTAGPRVVAVTVDVAFRATFASCT